MNIEVEKFKCIFTAHKATMESDDSEEIMNNKRYLKESYDAVIIGGALAGCASALTLAKKGLNVLVAEQHNLPGGVATSFVRGGVEIEASLHEMMSIGPKECPLKIRNFFDEMGVDIEWLRVPEAYRFVDEETGTDALVHPGTHGNFDNFLPGIRISLTGSIAAVYGNRSVVMQISCMIQTGGNLYNILI